jgi:hypothetical protein
VYAGIGEAISEIVETSTKNMRLVGMFAI